MNYRTLNRDYTAQDIEAWFEGYKRHITHVVVAHTHHRPYIASTNTGRFKHVNPASYLSAKLAETSRSTRYALNCLNRLLYPSHTNRARQNPDRFKPFSFVTIEGAKETTDKAQTIHLNIALGNLPKVLTTEDIETLFRHVWHEKAKQKDDVKVLDYDGGNWVGYTLKEAQQQPSRAWDTDSIWDVSNCWIPHSALNED
jgi:hypothetical protein